MSSSVAESILAASTELCERLERLQFGLPTAHVYNPLVYAWNSHSAYLRRWAANEKRVVFLGMNPGPWGMAQTGVPFGEVDAVRNWIACPPPASRPVNEHPKRPVLGFACGRSEPSGRRLWGLMRKRFETPERFFAEHLVLNYCPLLFLEESGRNRTPDKLPKAEADPVRTACDTALGRILMLLKPAHVVGVGRYAEAALTRVVADHPALAQMRPRICGVLHPSPANPRANAGWDGAVVEQLTQAGVW